MSTRCQILVDGSSAIIYRHSDGYPDGPHGVIADIGPLVKEFMELRGEDPDFLTAQIVAKLVKDRHENQDRYEESQKRNGIIIGEITRQHRYSGFGVEGWNPDAEYPLHGDIAYLYVVKKDHIEVRKARFPGMMKSTLENTTLIQCVDFDGNEKNNGN